MTFLAHYFWLHYLSI